MITIVSTPKWRPLHNKRVAYIMSVFYQLAFKLSKFIRFPEGMQQRSCQWLWQQTRRSAYRRGLQCRHSTYQVNCLYVFALCRSTDLVSEVQILNLLIWLARTKTRNPIASIVKARHLNLAVFQCQSVIAIIRASDTDQLKSNHEARICSGKQSNESIKSNVLFIEINSSYDHI
jgi:hypothetical protein